MNAPENTPKTPLPSDETMKRAYLAGAQEEGITPDEAEATWAHWVSEQKAQALLEAAEQIDIMLGHGFTSFGDVAATRAAKSWLSRRGALLRGKSHRK